MRKVQGIKKLAIRRKRQRPGKAVVISLAVKLTVESDDLRPLATLQVVNINLSRITFRNINRPVVPGDGESHVDAGGLHVGMLGRVAGRNLLHSGCVAGQRADDRKREGPCADVGRHQQISVGAERHPVRMRLHGNLHTFRRNQSPVRQNRFARRIDVGRPVPRRRGQIHWATVLSGLHQQGRFDDQEQTHHNQANQKDHSPHELSPYAIRNI